VPADGAADPAEAGKTGPAEARRPEPAEAGKTGPAEARGPEPAEAGKTSPAEAERDSTTGTRAGRNLPAAVGVGLLLGGLALVTLFTVKATFLVYLAAAVGIALWELSRALGTRDIHLPLVPVAAGSIAAIALAYWGSGRALVASLALTMIAILAWRLPGGTAGYLRDVTAGAFALGYLPLMASFVALMLAAPDGPRRVLVFLILVVCSDIGGYVTGILIVRHLMVPQISPKKTWEGFAGSALACAAAGAITLPLLLHGAAWQGLLVGLAALLAAALGDLTESMMKRDLEIKDMGTVLPGHGGVLDRLDSLALAAPVVWLLLAVFVPVAGHG
jgi:phosphatidate cytidylyltransferase